MPLTGQLGGVAALHAHTHTRARARKTCSKGQSAVCVCVCVCVKMAVSMVGGVWALYGHQAMVGLLLCEDVQSAGQTGASLLELSVTELCYSYISLALCVCVCVCVCARACVRARASEERERERSARCSLHAHMWISDNGLPWSRLRSISSAPSAMLFFLFKAPNAVHRLVIDRQRGRVHCS